MRTAPIVITGCPRSGTQMMARVFGSLSRDFFLISEHSNKSVDVPEEVSQVLDHQLWWDHFEYQAWNDAKMRPSIDVPIPSAEAIQRIRARYLELAQGRRLVIKNPSHILYPDLMRRVFPDAKFVYCIRNPWHTLQSMVKKGRDSFLLLTPRAADRCQSLLVRAAIGWGDAFSSYQRSRDKNWVVAKYEQLVDSPRTSIAGICQKLGLREGEMPGLDRAAVIPQPARANFYFIKHAFHDSPDKACVTNELRTGCEELGYPLVPDNLRGMLVTYAFEQFAEKFKRKATQLTRRRVA
ncbi:MAG: sulfotransferase [Pirellulales bacterium]|nr:sulfotransferase [Pirellulales bacterium]